MQKRFVLTFIFLVALVIILAGCAKNSDPATGYGIFDKIFKKSSSFTTPVKTEKQEPVNPSNLVSSTKLLPPVGTTYSGISNNILEISVNDPNLVLVLRKNNNLYLQYLRDLRKFNEKYLTTIKGGKIIPDLDIDGSSVEKGCGKCCSPSTDSCHCKQVSGCVGCVCVVPQ